ncbi:DNRLRE domain-containing protein [bacterium]|nr:DNRLRE domain-containing protein [bacterium]
MKTGTRWLLLATIALMMCHVPALGSELSPCDDMYSDPEHPGTPPTLTELWCATYSGAGHYERIMIKFSQAELEVLVAGAAASEATLNLYRFFGCPSHPYTSLDIYAGTTDWDEETWPVTQHLPHETNPVASCVFGPDNGWYAMDITALVNSWLEGTRPNCGLVIQARVGEKWSKFRSKEYSAASMRPFLDVEPDWTGVTDADPSSSGLGCAPNPFNPLTTLSYTLAVGSEIQLRLYDIRGRLVRSLVSGHMPAGRHEVQWDGRDENGAVLPSGCYMAMLETDEDCLRIKLSLVK